jgi:hypothetical protein
MCVMQILTWTRYRIFEALLGQDLGATLYRSLSMYVSTIVCPSSPPNYHTAARTNQLLLTKLPFSKSSTRTSEMEMNPPPLAALSIMATRSLQFHFSIYVHTLNAPYDGLWVLSRLLHSNRWNTSLFLRHRIPLGTT